MPYRFYFCCCYACICTCDFCIYTRTDSLASLSESRIAGSALVFFTNQLTAVERDVCDMNFCTHSCCWNSDTLQTSLILCRIFHLLTVPPPSSLLCICFLYRQHCSPDLPVIKPLGPQILATFSFSPERSTMYLDVAALVCIALGLSASSLLVFFLATRCDESSPEEFWFGVVSFLLHFARCFWYSPRDRRALACFPVVYHISLAFHLSSLSLASYG